MRTRWRVLGCAVAAVMSSVACGQPAEPPAPAAAPQAPASQDAAAQVAQGADAIAKGFAQMMQGATDGKIAVLPFETLEKALPDVPGWSRGTPKGSSTTMPFAMSQSQVDYDNGDQHLEIAIVDTALNQALLAPMSMFLAAGYSERSSDGFKRGTTVNGEPAFEEWNAPDRSGEVTVVVAKRFIVTAKGREVPDIAPVRAALERMDFAALAAAK